MYGLGASKGLLSKHDACFCFFCLFFGQKLGFAEEETVNKKLQLSNHITQG